MQFRQYIAEFGRFGFAGSEGGAVDSAQGADQGVPVLSADFPVLVPMSVIDAHGKSLSGGWVEKVKAKIEFGSTHLQSVEGQPGRKSPTTLPRTTRTQFHSRANHGSVNNFGLTI